MVILVAVWAAAITMPFGLVAAVTTARWRAAGVLSVLFAMPHLPFLPSCPPLLRGYSRAALQHWMGESAPIRFIDVSGGGEASEPEPEPEVLAGRGPHGERKQLLCIHPHGIYTITAFVLTQNRPDVRLCSSGYLYHCAPCVRLFASLIGIKMGSVAPGDLAKAMKAGDSPLALVPGGFEEATITCSGHERVFLKTRKGFVKYALRHGYDLVPVYGVGETDLVSNAQGGWWFRFMLNKVNIPAVLPWGYPLMPLFPRRGVPMTVAVGSPVEMPHIPKPTAADVKKHHDRYMRAVEELYEKARVGTPSEKRPLEVM